MARKGNKSNAIKYQRYKNGGRKLINKAEKQKKHEKRMAKFAARKEAGKRYEYAPIPYAKDSKAYREEALVRSEKNVDRRLPLQKWTSIWRKLNNELNKEAQARKDAERLARK